MPIRLYGDPVLSTRAMEVKTFDDELRRLTSSMLETMESAGGVGLAANQVGIVKRVFVYDCSAGRSGLRGIMVNPVWRPIGEDTQRGTEGCLSIPGVSAMTERFNTVSASGFDVEGRPVSIVASGLLARCIQHETDHLDGVLFLQRLDADERRRAMAEIRVSTWFSAD